MYTCRRGIPEADGARGASLQELAGVWGIYFSVNDCRSVWLALIYILIVCMVLKTTCVCCERELNVWPQNFFSLQWNWNRFLIFFVFWYHYLQSESGGIYQRFLQLCCLCRTCHLQYVSIELFGLLEGIIFSITCHISIKMMQMNVWEGRHCLIRKESACLNNQDLAIPIQDSET